MPRKAGQKPKPLGTVMSLCGAIVALLAACKTGDDSRLASALEPAVAVATAPTALVSYSAVVLPSSAPEADENRPDVEAAVYRLGTAPRWEFAEGIKASQPHP